MTVQAAQQPNRSAAPPQKTGTLARGLYLLELVNKTYPVRVSELVDISGLPKPTVSRILSTLAREGYITKTASTGCYVPTSQVSGLSDGLGHTEWIYEVVAPELDRLASIIQWPSDFAIFQGRGMSIQYSTRKTAPLNDFPPPINVSNIPMFDSDFGRAVLAWASESQRTSILQALSKFYRTTEPGALRSDVLIQELEETRRRGYAVRGKRFRFVGSNTVAVGVVLESRCIGAFNVLCKANVMNEAEIPRLYLEEMTKTARRISNALKFDGLRVLPKRQRMSVP